MIGMIAFILALWVIALLTYSWVLKSALNESELDWDHEAGQHLAWLDRTFNANRRRKRVEKALRKQRNQTKLLWSTVELLNTKLQEQEARNQSLAADLAAALLNFEDKAKIRESLVRKIR